MKLNELSGQNTVDLPQLITKPGARHPGLIGSRGKPFHSPIVGRVVTHSVDVNDSSRNYQLKRRSDISHDLLRAKNIEDEDSFIGNQDLEALCKNQKSSTIIKRTKFDKS